MTQARRRRGRPSGADVADRRAALLDAATEQFAAKGFTGASLRAIAAQAQVDASLVGHYFGDKQGLFIATLDLPVNPLEKLRAVVEPGPDGLGERLVRTFLTSWDPHASAFAALVRSGFGGEAQTPAPVADVVRNVVRDLLSAHLTGQDVELRASLVATQMVGLGITRYVIGVEPLASADVADVVRLHAPLIQQLIDEP